MLTKNVLNLKCCYLNHIKYQQATQLQKALVQWHVEDLNAKSTLLLLQHFPVYTVGIRSSMYENVESDYLKSLGADFITTNRGGLITFHGSGQLVAYPILNLRKLKMGVRKYVSSLEEVIIQFLSKEGIESNRSPHTGVWVGNDKICAMGINVQRGVTSHGLALNCNTDLKWFNHIVPCGIHGKGVTSMSDCLKRNIDVESVLVKFLTTFEDVFEFQSSDVEHVPEQLTAAEKLETIADCKLNIYDSVFLNKNYM